MKKLLLKTLHGFLYLFIVMISIDAGAQNVFSGEPVQWVGRPNGYSTEPYNSDYRTLGYRKVSTTAANPADGRGQWATTINVQATGGNITPDNMPGGAGAGWLLISGPSGNRFANKWNFSGVGQAASNALNNITLQGGGEDMGLDMSTSGHYTFVMRDAGYANSEVYIGYTAAAPVTVSRILEGFFNGQLVVGVVAGGTPSAGENIYLRYSTTANDFTTGTSVVQATGSGTTWAAAIPSQPCGTTIYYYIFSSTRTLAQINAASESDRSLGVLRFDDNSGANYSIVVGPPSTAAVLTGEATICAGEPATLTVDITGGLAPFSVVLSDGTTSTTIDNYTSGDPIEVTPSATATYTITSVTSANGCAGTGNSGSAAITVNPLVTYYADTDEDGFGDPAVSQTSCDVAPDGFVTDNTDCDDTAILFEDLDADGFGSDVVSACGVVNSDDCDDTALFYTDEDFDGFGVAPFVPCAEDGSDNNLDCDDNAVTFEDLDGDTFGSEILAACGVANSDDCDDTVATYEDLDEDGFGSDVFNACSGIANSDDCDDALVQFEDLDGDGDGSEVLVACDGVLNSDDCDDTAATYEDLDQDGFGSDIVSSCSGVPNSDDCDDNLVLFADTDGDGFGSEVLVACDGVTNSDDCDDTDPELNGQGGTYYQDLDGDEFGNPLVSIFTCAQPDGYVIDNTDCDDTDPEVNAGTASTYFADADGDGFGNGDVSVVACVQPDGYVANREDCDDAILYYIDADGDGFGSDTFVACPEDGVADTSDCDDTLLLYIDSDSDGFGGETLVACDGVINSDDCDDANPDAGTGDLFYADTDGDGYGNAADSVTDCVAPDGYVANNTDCDDANPAANPGATEIGYNVIDDDCDGSIDEGFPPLVSVVPPSSCGITLAKIDSYVYSSLVAGAQGYQFRVTTMTGPNAGQVQFVDTPLRALKFTWMESYAFNTTYQVEVAVRFNGVLQPYTPSTCTVTTPAPTTQLAVCGSTLLTLNDLIYANIVPFAAGYRFRITDQANGANTQEIDRPLRDVRLSYVTAFPVEFGGVYNIDVAVKNTDGTYLPYGAVCQVTAPSGALREIETFSMFNAVASPNPFVDSFKINLTTATQGMVDIKAYDVTGRLLDSQEIKTSQLESFNLGDRYPAGVYNIIVTQGENEKVLRVIKR